MSNAAKLTVVYDDGSEQGSWELDPPERLAEAGDVYEATEHFYTLGGAQYFPGDRFYVLERTQLAPFHRTSSVGNLLIQGKTKTSVWAEFDAGIAQGRFRLITPEPTER